MLVDSISKTNVLISPAALNNFYKIVLRLVKATERDGEELIFNVMLQSAHILPYKLVQMITPSQVNPDLSLKSTKWFSCLTFTFTRKKSQTFWEILLFGFCSDLDERVVTILSSVQ